MEKITFVDNVTKANADTFNTMQDNIEDAIDEVNADLTDDINNTISYIDEKTNYSTTTYTSNGVVFRFEKVGRVVVIVIEGTTTSNLVAGTSYTFSISNVYTPTADFRSNVVLIESGQTCYITISGTTVSYRTYTTINSPTYPRSSITYIANN